MDGVSIYRTTTASLGTAGLRTIQIGNDKQSPFALYADNIEARLPVPCHEVVDGSKRLIDRWPSSGLWDGRFFGAVRAPPHDHSGSEQCNRCRRA
jgi:hypothetical protein